MDTFDHLAWIAAQEVLALERITPGRQDRALVAAAEQVVRLLSSESASHHADPEASRVVSPSRAA